MTKQAKRHPIRAAFGGLLLGLGLAIVLVSYKAIALGTLTPFVVIVAGVVAGIAFAMLVPAFGSEGGDKSTAVPAAPEPVPAVPPSSSVATTEGTETS